jgi:hypothetical protein
MEIIEVLTHIDIVHTEMLLDGSDTCLCESGSLLLLIDLVVDFSLE